MLTTAVQAQNPDNDQRYKQQAGRYGGNSGICLFDDGKFMLYGYATRVFGSYAFEADHLLFYPDKPELFIVFAHKNPIIGDSTRINFVNFERGKAFIQFDNNKPHQVFNDGANCFDAPFVYQIPATNTRFTLSNAVEDEYWYNGQAQNSWHYNNDKGYNDFLLVYNKPEREYENFAGVLSIVENTGVIKLSNYSGGGGFLKEPTDNEWQEILTWKNQYFESKAIMEDILFANKHYATFAPHLDDYHYDEKSGVFVNKDTASNEAYFRQNQYQDDRYLRKYIKLQPANKDTSGVSKKDLAPSSIFFTVCGEGSERSYHYNGIIKYDDKDDDRPIPTTTTPVVQ